MNRHLTKYMNDLFKGKNQLAAELKDKEIISLKEELKLLQVHIINAITTHDTIFCTLL